MAVGMLRYHVASFLRPVYFQLNVLEFWWNVGARFAWGPDVGLQVYGAAVVPFPHAGLFGAADPVGVIFSFSSLALYVTGDGA